MNFTSRIGLRTEGSHLEVRKFKAERGLFKNGCKEALRPFRDCSGVLLNHIGQDYDWRVGLYTCPQKQVIGVYLLLRQS